VIHVIRNPSLIPEKLLLVAERAQIKLEGLPESQRSAFIKRKSHIWRAFARYLAQMSYGKCWYSETLDPQSFFDVDHFRPKGEAIRAEGEKDTGYPWLAFNWENFRYAAQRSNRESKDEDTGVVVGKSSWFPLLQGSPKACWVNRCVAQEQPVLLDPTVRVDADLIDVNDDGMMCPSPICIGSGKERVQQSIERYGLNLPRLVAARKRTMREIVGLYTSLNNLIDAGNQHSAAADLLKPNVLVEQMRLKVRRESPYSKAAKAQLAKLGTVGTFILSSQVDESSIGATTS
jgi:hypothetical protein